MLHKSPVALGVKLGGGQHCQVASQTVAFGFCAQAGHVQLARGKLQLLITRSCRLTPFLGRQGHIGGEQAGEHHPCQLRAMLIVKALQMERQVRRLEARQRAHPAAHLLVEPMIQDRAGIHEDHPLQPLTVVKGIGAF